MNEMHKKALIDFLIENRLVDVEVEEKIVKEEYTVDSGEKMGVTSSGVQYPQKLVMKYITDHGYQITPETIELVVKKLQNEGGLTSEQRKIVYNSSINNASEEELRDALDLGIAKLLVDLKDYALYNQAQYDFRYQVRYYIDDGNGILPVGEIAEDISSMKADGWEIKHTFTKNAKIVGRGVSGQNISVADERLQGVLYIIYEKRFVLR